LENFGDWETKDEATNLGANEDFGDAKINKK
jgi:hypothetical protein